MTPEHEVPQTAKEELMRVVAPEEKMLEQHLLLQQLQHQWVRQREQLRLEQHPRVRALEQLWPRQRELEMHWSASCRWSASCFLQCFLQAECFLQVECF